MQALVKGVMAQGLAGGDHDMEHDAAACLPTSEGAYLGRLAGRSRMERLSHTTFSGGYEHLLRLPHCHFPDRGSGNLDPGSGRFVQAVGLHSKCGRVVGRSPRQGSSSRGDPGSRDLTPGAPPARNPPNPPLGDVRAHSGTPAGTPAGTRPGRASAARRRGTPTCSRRPRPMLSP